MGYDPSAQAYQGLMQSGTFLNPYEFRGAIARQNIANRSRYSDYGFNPYSQNYMNQYQSNRMGAPVMVSPTEENRKQYSSQQIPQFFSSGEQFYKNTQPIGGGKGGRPSGTMNMNTAPAGIGGKR